jgi:hypothetical protein
MAECSPHQVEIFSQHIVVVEERWATKLENLDDVDAEVLLTAYDDFAADYYRFQGVDDNPVIQAYALEVFRSLKAALIRRLKPWKRDPIREMFG